MPRKKKSIKGHAYRNSETNEMMFVSCGGDVKLTGQPLEEGKPIHNFDEDCEFATVRPDPSDPGHALYEPAEEVSKGPTKVATPAYREGWDRVFNKDMQN